MFRGSSSHLSLSNSAHSSLFLNLILLLLLVVLVRETAIMSTFSCPTLTRKEVVKILADSQIFNINENEFANPTPNFVTDLYVALLVHLDLLKEDHSQVEFTALERFENVDMHSDAIRIMNLFSKIKRALAAVHAPMNFTLDDLVRPDINRTLKFVSAIVNFILYKDGLINNLAEEVTALGVLDEQHRECEAKISQLNEEISVFNEAREKDVPLVQELEAKVKDLENTIRNLNTNQSSLRTTFRKLKEKGKEMEEKISKAEFELLQSVQENASLQSKLVHSPDKLQHALEEKKALLSEVKNFERLAMKDYEDKAALYEVHTKASKKISKHLALMQSLHEQVVSAKSLEKNVKQLKAKLVDYQLQERSLDARLVELQGTAEQFNKSKKQAEKDKDQKFEAFLKELNIVELEVKSRRQDLEAREREIESVLAKVEAMTLEINAAKESSGKTQQALFMKCEAVVKEWQQYWSSIQDPLFKIGGALDG